MLPDRGLTRSHLKRAFPIFLTATVTAAAMLAAAPAHAAPAPAARGLAVLAASAAPRVPAGATRAGALTAGTRLTVEVTLNVRNQPGLNTLLGGLADKTSPYFHDFLSPARFDAAFSPATAAVDAVDAALRDRGLAPGQASADRLSIPVTATAAQLSRALGITLAAWRLRDGRTAYANTTAPKVPAQVAPLVQGIIGLNDLYPVRSDVQPVTRKDTARAQAAARAGQPPRRARMPAGARTRPAVEGPQPCAAARDNALSGDGFTEDLLADSYGLNGLYNLGDLGQGKRIALLELEPTVHSDIGVFEQCYGISTPVNYISIDGGATGDPAQSGEAPMDIEVAASLAPDTTIDVYQAPNSTGGPGSGMYDIFHRYVTADTESVMSVSWGLCENEESLADQQGQETLFEKANAQGQTILAAAGDNGSTGCYNDSDSNNTLSVSMPASAPYVTSVGGTYLPGDSPEVAWNESDLYSGATGGGTSGTFAGGRGWCMPGYQDQLAIPGLISAYSAAAPGCATRYFREVPDISADADPFSAYGFYAAGLGGWTAEGGTSAATPLWAAIAALTDASPFCSGYGSGNAGVLPQALYAAVARAHSFIYSSGSQEALYDVTSGNNDYTPSGYDGGLYPATTGYDMATGLGTPDVTGIDGNYYSYYYPGYTALVCGQLATRHLQVTRVSPAAGRAGAAATIVIHGTGFLPVVGANLVREYAGSTLLATFTPVCTTTACTIALPAESARTVDLEVSTEDSAYTAANAADHYTYATAPHVTGISPPRGTHNGGTKVTLTGTNLIGIRSVTFNGRAGTRIAVSGSTALTTLAPRGTKGARVKVIITAAGGTSNSVLYLYT